MMGARKSKKFATTAAEYAAIDFVADQKLAAMSKTRHRNCEQGALKIVSFGISLATGIMIHDKAAAPAQRASCPHPFL
jgi:hypothetical protein